MSLKIKDLKPHMENVTLIAKVIQKSEPTWVGIDKKKYSSAIVEDETGRIKLNLWREQVEQVKEGDVVKISSAFVHIRNQILQISTWSSIQTIGHEK